MKLKRFLNASMILAFLAMSQTALAQAFTVQGRVVDESGEPMIGVAVTNKDGNTLGVTDADGRYSIELNSPTKLKFTFVGSETITIDAKKATQKDIVMRQTATALDDVVVVGYGTQKKINLTGAVQSINSKDILRANVSNGSSALQGIVPGLTAVQSSGQPGNDQASLKLRGLGSLNSSTSPLILIDGVEGDFNRIDLNSIETISVLKDAASASIYGSRASNGVILITTKRGYEGKPTVTFNGYVGMNTPTTLPEPATAIEYMQAVDIARQMRQLVRRERKVEFVLEGLLFVDVRRWGIGDLLNEHPTYGQPLPEIRYEGLSATDIPSFKTSDRHDLNDIPSYEAYKEKLRVRDKNRFWAPRFTQWPIPRLETDRDPNLTNPDY